MVERQSMTVPADDEFIVFCTSGESVKGEYRCTDCGYGVASFRELPLCPMCGGSTWEPAAWSPLTRARAN